MEPVYNVVTLMGYWVMLSSLAQGKGVNGVENYVQIRTGKLCVVAEAHLRIVEKVQDVIAD